MLIISNIGHNHTWKSILNVLTETSVLWTKLLYENNHVEDDAAKFSSCQKHLRLHYAIKVPIYIPMQISGKEDCFGWR